MRCADERAVRLIRGAARALVTAGHRSGGGGGAAEDVIVSGKVLSLGKVPKPPGLGGIYELDLLSGVNKLVSSQLPGTDESLFGIESSVLLRGGDTRPSSTGSGTCTRLPTGTRYRTV